jgi:endoglucanase
MHLRLPCLALLFALALPVAAQDRAAELQNAFHRAQHLKRGINASEWFAQSPRDYSAARTDRYTTPRTLR